jgi:hypothetical protein
MNDGFSNEKFFEENSKSADLSKMRKMASKREQRDFSTKK